MSTDQVKETLRMMPYGFYAVTSKSGSDSNAMVVNWITQISFEPRRVALALQPTSYTYGLINTAKVLVVNLFNKEDIEYIKPFTKGRSKDPEKMKDAQYTEAPITGCPVLKNAAAYLECKVVAIHDDGGDHHIVVGEVIGAGINKPGKSSDTLSLPDLGWSYAG